MRLQEARSLLYVPSNRLDRLEKARGSGADLVICDLEDSVPLDLKPEARRAVSDALGRDNRDVAVRVDLSALADDVNAIEQATIVVLPAATVQTLDQFADLWGNHAPQPEVLALIETAQGIAEADRIAAHPWTSRLGMGEVDLCAELGIAVEGDRQFVWPYRAQIVLHSRAAGLPAPVGATETKLGDAGWTRHTTELQRNQGFRGRTAIHPEQIAVINDAYTPSGANYREALEILADFEGRQKSGQGAFRDSKGQLVDAATVRRARATVEIYEASERHRLRR